MYLCTFYITDVGVVPHRKSAEIPDITEIMKADSSENPDSFYNDPEISQMRIQVDHSAFIY